jgi:hypothetical protein
MLKHLSFLVICLSGLAYAAEPTADEVRQMEAKLMAQTRVVAVRDLNFPASEFKSDGDPNTLEVVFLTKKEDGPSRVSDDGEVIFLYKPSAKEEQALIEQAFKIRALRVLKGHLANN